jgi:ubiquinone/menaquinone biosynthesis C-methylase UbiE
MAAYYRLRLFMDNDTLEKKIKEANRAVYNNKSVEEYNRNESIFNPARQRAVRKVFQAAVDHRKGKNDNFLDIGTGTGHILPIANEFYENIFACDISENMLIQIQDNFPFCSFFASDAENLPVEDDSMNFVSCYAMLHHLLKHDKVFNECYRVLKPGGILYTDHDPNYFFNRFYHIFYRLKHKNKPGFGSDLEELAEYHNAYSSGINPEELKRILKEIGFSKVKITYRMTDKTNWTGIKKIAVLLLKLTVAVIPVKIFFTHFSIVAEK